MHDWKQAGQHFGDPAPKKLSSTDGSPLRRRHFVVRALAATNSGNVEIIGCMFATSWLGIECLENFFFSCEVGQCAGSKA